MNDKLDAAPMRTRTGVIIRGDSVPGVVYDHIMDALETFYGPRDLAFVPEHDDTPEHVAVDCVAAVEFNALKDRYKHRVFKAGPEDYGAHRRPPKILAVFCSYLG